MSRSATLRPHLYPQPVRTHRARPAHRISRRAIEPRLCDDFPALGDDPWCLPVAAMIWFVPLRHHGDVWTPHKISK
jgi:hypothetical protein